MVTDYPHRLASPGGKGGEIDAHRAVEDVGAVGVLDRIRQVFCGFHGHDNLLQFEQDRMFLRCVSCGHESPGWELTETPPTVKAPREVRRPALVGPHLVGARRIA